MFRAALISLIALGLVAQEPPKPTPAQTSAPAAAAKPAAAAPEAKPAPHPDDVVLAKVGGEPITEADFRASFRLIPQQEQMQILMLQGGKEEFIKRMAESKLLAAKAKSMGLDKTADFQRTLDRTKDDLLAREFLTKEGEALQKKLKVSDPEVKAYYDAHLDKFKQPELVSVRHILVAVKRDPKEKAGLTDAEAKLHIAKLQADLKKGMKFEDLAKKFSDDPGSKENGGLYKDVDPSNWDKDFAKAAMTQPIGKVGAPVKTQFGYHLIKVEDRKPARLVPFEEAKAEAEQLAQRDRQAEVWDQLMDGLKKEIPFELTKPAPSDLAKAKAAVEPAPAKATEPAAPKAEAPKASAPAKGGAH
jgi:parvulin-like peptidyl-prolyl isomerase